MKGMSTKAVSTALTYIVLLSITLVLLVFTLQSFVDFQVQLKEPMDTSLEASKTLSQDYASMIGLQDPEVDPSKIYSGPEDAELSIQTFPPYTLDSANYITVQIKNPTENIMKIPELSATSDFFQKSFKDIRVIYTHKESIYFTPGSTGEFEIESTIKDGPSAQEEITVLSEGHGGDGNGGSSGDSGTHTFKVLETKVKTLDTLSINMSCEYGHASHRGDYWSGSGVSISITNITPQISFGYAGGSHFGHSSIFGCGGCHNAHIQNKYWGCFRGGGGSCVSIRGMQWTNGTSSTFATATGGCYMGEVCSSSVGVGAIEITPKINEVTYITMSLLEECADNDWHKLINDFPRACSCAENLTVTLPYWDPPTQTIFKVDSETVRKGGDRMTFFNETSILQTKLYQGNFRVPDPYVDEATLYLFTQEDINITLKINGFPILEDWTQLQAYTTTNLDISGKVAPNNMDNSIEMWLIPRDKGSYPISWQVETGPQP